MDTTSNVLLTVSLIVALTYLVFAPLFTPKRPAILPSPLKTLPPAQLSSLIYPPDFFPGARDATSPYGSIRCYEFGPETGRKVLLLHGISTSCMTLTHIAHGLAARGCRVLLFDLFGRGYSDGVGDLPYDARLFVAQALCVLASSPLAWTGDDGFDVLGYSLGGAIAVHVATAFPAMVRSVVLLAPAGMIRAENFGLAARLVFRSGWVPAGVLEAITRWRLKRPIAEAAKRKPRITAGGGGGGGTAATATATAAATAAASQLAGDKTVEAAVTSEIVDEAPAAPNELQKRVLAFVNWQVEHHAGFVSAFMSTLRYAPMLDQHAAWAKLAKRKPRTVCLIFGEGDEIVNEDDYREDVLPLIGGEDHVVWAKPVGGKHDFPMVYADETLERIFAFWS